MGNMADRRNPPSVMPDDIKNVFDESDVPKVFQYLEVTFHLSKKHYSDYQEKLKKQMRDITSQEFCCIYLRQQIEPSINHLIWNTDSLFRIIRYLLKDKILAYKKEQEAHKVYYRKGRT